MVAISCMCMCVWMCVDGSYIKFREASLLKFGVASYLGPAIIIIPA